MKIVILFLLAFNATVNALEINEKNLTLTHVVLDSYADYDNVECFVDIVSVPAGVIKKYVYSSINSMEESECKIALLHKETTNLVGKKIVYISHLHLALPNSSRSFSMPFFIKSTLIKKQDPIE